MERTIKRIPFAGYGVKQLKEGAYFSAVLPAIRECGVIIFDLNGKEKPEKIPFDKSLSCGNVYSCLITGLSLKGKGYRFFCDEKDFVDDYAVSVAGNELFGKGADISKLMGITEASKDPKGFDSDRPLKHTYENTILYLAHLRGFTMGNPGSSKDKGTFRAFEKEIPYLKDLGITAVLLMPVYEFVEKELKSVSEPETKASLNGFREDENSKKVNFWGFCKAFPFAVKRSYADSSEPGFELKKFVKKLHDNDIECLFTVFSDIFKDTGSILDCLRYYVYEYHADGFRIVGNSRFNEEICKDPFLYDSKLIFEGDPSFVPFDETKTFRNIAIIGDSFERQGRRFLKSDEDAVSYLSYAVRENSRIYSPIRNITDFSGFTLYDVFSYNRKHNEANNEENLDGTDYNYSWNCGFEGETGKRHVNALRLKQCKNAMLLMLLSQGTPMLVAGDEVLNTAYGNNNPYCQDNETGWVLRGKTKASREFKAFVSNLIAFRKRHSILHQPNELKLFDYRSCKMPDVSFHGEEAWKIDQTPASREFAVLYSGEYARQYTKETEDSVYIIYNMYWEKRAFVLPVQGPKVKWSLLYSSDGSTDNSFDEQKATPLTGGEYLASERSISILLLKSENIDKSKK